MPWVLIHTPEPVENTAKFLERLADDPPDFQLLGDDSLVADIGRETDDGLDPRKAAKRARQARYRARKRAPARDARDAENDASRDAENDARDAKILEIPRGNYSLPALEGQGERVIPGKTTRRATRRDDAENDATRRDANDDWRNDRLPLTDEERARARAGLDSARAALKARRSGT